MPRFNDIINNFINGEVSPKIYGRSDSEIYKRACRTLQNRINHPQGGVSRRTGTERLAYWVGKPSWATEAISSSARIVPFYANRDEPFLLLFNASQGVSGNNEVHVYDPVTDTFIATVHQNTYPITWPDIFSNNDLANGTKSDALILDNVLKEMQYVQIGDVMIFVHDQIPPFCIFRKTIYGALADAPAFYMTDYASNYSGPNRTTTDFGPIPFGDINTTGKTMTLSGVTVGSKTLTCSHDYFTSDHIGAAFCFIDSGTEGVGHITGYTDEQNVTINLTRAAPAAFTSPLKTWYESDWSYELGWPQTVSHWQGRLIFGGSRAFPTRLWGSQRYDIFEMTNTRVVDPGEDFATDDPFVFDLASDKSNQIQWLYSGSNLLVGTEDKEYSISDLEFSTSGISNITYGSQTSSGSDYIQPIAVEDVPVFVQKGGRKFREMLFDFRSQGYTANDISFFAEHMLRKSESLYPNTAKAKVRQLAYQHLDNQIVWMLDSNGLLFGCTRSRENVITAFHYHLLGGVHATTTYPKVKSIATLPSVDGTYDDLYMIVERTVNSSTVVSLERLGSEFYSDELDINTDQICRLPIFVDQAHVYKPEYNNANITKPTFYARLRDNKDADISAGSATGTVTGTVNYTRYMAQMAAASSYISYDGTDNADTAQVGCIRFTVSGSNGFGNTMLSVSKSNASADNLIRIYSGTGQDLRVNIKDSAGTNIFDTTFGDVGGGLGQHNAKFAAVHEIELNYDLTAGATRLFVNGVQLGATETSTGTRDTSIDNIVIGANYDGSLGIGSTTTENRISNVAIFDQVQHTADFHNFIYQPKKHLSIYNLDYLEGETVQVLGDGKYLGDFTVTNGAITLTEWTYDTLIVGLKYTDIAEIQAIDAGSGIGSAQGAIKRIDQVIVRVRDTAAISIGPSMDNLEPQILRKASTPMNKPIELVTDDIEVELDSTYDRNARVVVSSDVPLPSNVTCIVLRGITSDV